MANKDRYRPSRGVPKRSLVPRGEGMVRTIYPQERREFVPRGEPPHREGGRRVRFGRGEFVGHFFTRGQYEYGGKITVLGPRGATGHGLPFVVRVVLQGDVWLFHLGVIGWILLSPLRDMGTHGSPLIRIPEVLVKWTQPARSPADLQMGPETLSTIPATSKDLGRPHPDFGRPVGLVAQAPP
jgi:hypothetical protein